MLSDITSLAACASGDIDYASVYAAATKPILINRAWNLLDPELRSRLRGYIRARSFNGSVPGMA